MEHKKNKRSCCAIWASVVFGIVVALLWVFGLIPGIRFMIPYAAADTMLMLALTSIITIVAGCCTCSRCGGRCLPTYIKIILIAAGIYLVFVLIYAGTVLSLTLKIILSFVGAISFCTMLTTFIAAVIDLLGRRCE